MSETTRLATDGELGALRAQAEDAERSRDAAIGRCVAAQERVEELEARLVCGHRKADNDDSYGGCVFCGFKDGYHEYEAELKEAEARLAKVMPPLYTAERIVFDTYSNAQKLPWGEVEANCKEAMRLLQSALAAARGEEEK